MSRNNRLRHTGRSDKPAPHVRLHHWLMKTPAWRSLGANARALYVELSSRYRGPGSNNGRIPYSVREAAAALHIGKSTAAKAFQELEERGFIVSVQKGGFNCKIRHSSEWLLTEHPCDVDIPDRGIKAGDLPTKEFARWPPEKQKPVPLVDRPVPAFGQFGTSAQTMVLKKAANGT